MFNYAECLETGVTVMAPVFLLQMLFSVETRERKAKKKKKEKIPNLIWLGQDLAPINDPRLRSFRSLCENPCDGMALLRLEC